MSSYTSITDPNPAMVTINKRWFILTIGVTLLAFMIGLLIGLYAPERYGSKSDTLLGTLTRPADQYVSDKLISGVDAGNIDKHLKFLTSQPHLAGTPGNKRVTDYIRDQWVQQGYTVETVPYDVLLSYPEENHHNAAKLLNADGSTAFTTAPDEHPYFTGESHPEVVQPYNAFSPSGEPEAELVFANYARDVDFDELINLGVNVTGKIVIAKYGLLFRGNKVDFAHKHGAVGVLLYMDPADDAKGNTTYPESVWLPPTGVQRGNIVLVKGDQATPGYPATWYTARISEDEIQAKLPKIPCHPINYGDAYRLLSEMSGSRAPDQWQGGLNITYRLGVTMKANKRVKLDVKNTLKTVRINVVTAIMKGNIEPDRFVILGNHNDAWVYGGSDPSSATAAILEMSRAFADQVQKGWKARRSVMFCSWDAEEFGLVGSYEWVEENVKWLSSQAVAYLNIDTLTTNNYTYYASATPTIKKAVHRAASKMPRYSLEDYFSVADPEVAGQTVYQVWSQRRADSEGKPSISMPGAGTDFVPFEQDVAIPTFTMGQSGMSLHGKLYEGQRGSPLYHTLYDGYRFSRMMDPYSRRGRAAAAVILELTRDLIDSPVLPFDVKDYAEAVAGFVTNLVQAEKERFRTYNIEFDGLESANENFTMAAENFHKMVEDIDLHNPIAVRGINDKLMTLEKSFQIHRGLPERPEYKHVLLSPSRANYYKTTTFPGMADLLYKIGGNADRWKQVAQHLSEITFCVQSAAKLLST